MNTAAALTEPSLPRLLDANAERAAAPLADPYARWHGHVARAVASVGKVHAVLTFPGKGVGPVWGQDRPGPRRARR